MTILPNLYPTIIDHWIYMEKQNNCSYKDAIALEWDHCCPYDIAEDEMRQSASNERTCRCTNMLQDF